MSITEQQILINSGEGIFKDELRVYELSDLNQNILSLKKLVLAKAFRGELGINNPKDNSLEVV